MLPSLILGMLPLTLAAAVSHPAQPLVRPLSITYETYKDTTGWSAPAQDGAPSGGREELEPVRSLRVSTNESPLMATVRYDVYLCEGGWQQWQSNDGPAAEPTPADEVEAVRMELDGLLAADYDLWYRVRVPELGWMGWAANGQSAGTTGLDLPVLLVQARLLPKGSRAPGPTSDAYEDEEAFRALDAAPADQDASEREVRPFGRARPGDEALRALDDAVRAVRATGTDLGFVMMDLESYAGVAYNCAKPFYAASSIKAPYMAGVVYLHPWALERYERQIRETLVYSWDHTYKELVSEFGETPLLVLMREAGVTFPYNWFSRTNPWSTFTARDMAKLWVRIYQLFGQSAACETFGSWSEGPETSAIHGQLGKRSRTRSKAGWVNARWAWNSTVDAGIVYADEGTYVIALMTDAPADFSKLTGVVDALDQVHASLR